MSSIVYIGMQLIRISPSDSFQLELSENAGISWRKQFLGSENMGEFYYLGKRNQTLFAKTAKGSFKSETLGKTWDIWKR